MDRDPQDPQRPRGRPPKRSEDDIYEVCRLIAEFKSRDYILDALKDRKITRSEVKHFATYARWQPLIQGFRNRYLESVADCAIAHKRVRLERLEAMWDVITKDEAALGSKDARRELRDILDQARMETDENSNLSVSFSHSTHFSVTGLKDEELKERLTHLRNKLLASPVGAL